jgi:hypothetical protein
MNAAAIDTTPKRDMPEAGDSVTLAGKEYVIGKAQIPDFTTLLNSVSGAVELYIQNDELREQMDKPDLSVEELIKTKFGGIKPGWVPSQEEWRESSANEYNLLVFCQSFLKHDDTAAMAVVAQKDSEEAFNLFMEGLLSQREEYQMRLDVVTTALARLAVVMDRAGNTVQIEDPVIGLSDEAQKAPADSNVSAASEQSPEWEAGDVARAGLRKALDAAAQREGETLAGSVKKPQGAS